MSDGKHIGKENNNSMSCVQLTEHRSVVLIITCLELPVDSKNANGHTLQYLRHYDVKTTSWPLRRVSAGMQHEKTTVI